MSGPDYDKSWCLPQTTTRVDVCLHVGITRASDVCRYGDEETVNQSQLVNFPIGLLYVLLMIIYSDGLSSIWCINIRDFLFVVIVILP